MSDLQYTTIDRIFSKFTRDLRGTDVNESDLIEWTGEALEFLKVVQIQEQALAFLEVKDYHAPIPDGFQMVLQIARDTKWTKQEDKCSCPKEIVEEIISDCNTCTGCKDYVVTDCQGNILCDYEIAYYRPYFDLKWEFQPWIMSNSYSQRYRPVRLANHSLFNSIVCKEKDDRPYLGNEDEYTIVGTTEKKIRTSFRDGYISLAYIRNAIDESTGYPLVPDNISYITAITYYIKWKIAESYSWNGRAGYDREADKAEQRWLKYTRQAKNWAKMPKTLDDFQDLLEQTHYLVPRHNRYYKFFGKTKR